VTVDEVGVEKHVPKISDEESSQTRSNRKQDKKNINKGKPQKEGGKEE
jgi:hypothetical protein